MSEYQPQFKYNLSELFQSAFGIATTVYIPQLFTPPPSQQINYDSIKALPEHYSSTDSSWMGTPIMFQAKFKGGSYMRYKANGEIEFVNMQDYKLPPATMFSFRRAHNITRTNLLGANGTVKEIYGFDDWVIDVKGLCLDEPSRSAHDQLKELLQWEKIADSIGISGELLEQREISQIAISDWSDNLQQGSSGVIPFSFQMWSDEDIILVL